jgi:3-phenylpropionate/trans-cinnamate dioxygenase ferredoxin reductase subunit
VIIHTGIAVSHIDGIDKAETVVLHDGTPLPADVIVVGVGLVPNTELASHASLLVENGIVTDANTRTSDPSIYAIGDCSNQANGFLGRRVRLESVPNAIEQARICAATICNKAATSNAVPWFWSEQFDLKLQIVGLTDGYDEVVLRGRQDTESFSVLYKKDGSLIAADTVNRPQDFVAAKQLVARRLSIASENLNNDSVPLSAYL